MLHIISIRAQISQNVKYWYEICDVLVPILHSVKFAKCEICGSTQLSSFIKHSDHHALFYAVLAVLFTYTFLDIISSYK